MKKFDTVVYIGRFQPFHNGHLEIINRAMTIGKKVVVIVGSANQPPTTKNPFSVQDRIAMIKGSINSDRLTCQYTYDSIYDDALWAARVRKIVSNFGTEKVAIIGHEKDESSFYLKMFPNWTFVPVELIGFQLSGSIIRDTFFSIGGSAEHVKDSVPSNVYEFLVEYGKSFEYATLLSEKLSYKKQQSVYKQLPYPPVFVTVDVVLECKKNILLIKRKNTPGMGLMALPGGFLDANKDKSLKHAAIRELIEETKIDIPEDVLMINAVGTKVFDAPNRSLRGRTITHAFHIKLKNYDLPYVKGSDDAALATFVPIEVIDRKYMFEDHYDIIMSFCGE